MKSRSYSELILLPTFEKRYEYLKLQGRVGLDTFGSSRYLNQLLYHDQEWRSVRDRVIIRDGGNDLGIEGRPINSAIRVHHINPISKNDVLDRSPALFDMDNLICCSLKTHNAIHYGNSNNLIRDPIERKPNDTCPWR